MNSRPLGGQGVPDYVCLFFDRDGIVRATDTVTANQLDDAVRKAQALFTIMTSLDRLELWQDGERMYGGGRQPPGNRT